MDVAEKLMEKTKKKKKQQKTNCFTVISIINSNLLSKLNVFLAVFHVLIGDQQCNRIKIELNDKNGYCVCCMWP